MCKYINTLPFPLGTAGYGGLYRLSDPRMYVVRVHHHTYVHTHVRVYPISSTSWQIPPFLRSGLMNIPWPGRRQSSAKLPNGPRRNAGLRMYVYTTFYIATGLTKWPHEQSVVAIDRTTVSCLWFFQALHARMLGCAYVVLGVLRRAPQQITDNMNFSKTHTWYEVHTYIWYIPVFHSKFPPLPIGTGRPLFSSH